MAKRPYRNRCEPGHGVRYDLARGAGVACADGSLAAAVIMIGTCGWSYDHWQPELYAPGRPARCWWDQEPEYRVMIGVLPPGRWTISVPESGGAIVDVKLGDHPPCPA
jgi:hypothetical protein